jgi:hypothetical protein
MSKPQHRRQPGVHPNQRPDPVIFQTVSVRVRPDTTKFATFDRVFRRATFRIFPVSENSAVVLSVTELASGRITLIPFDKVEEIVAEVDAPEMAPQS